jgi:hypothetical protein
VSRVPTYRLHLLVSRRSHPGPCVPLFCPVPAWPAPQPGAAAATATTATTTIASSTSHCSYFSFATTAVRAAAMRAVARAKEITDLWLSGGNGGGNADGGAQAALRANAHHMLGVPADATAKVCA